ncbi:MULTISPECIES: Sec-independent protein translocase TatB [unclassified Microbacterium]|uniref:Sec-independent protein translocase TatB n=1 Tax=unclassified Microbacterium TaxID=2609290 RepID=UPI0030100C10
MFFGITFEKLLLIGVIAALLVGPERLPRYAEALARFTRRAGEYVRGAKDRMREEVGPEIDELDWRKLDPRQYDPRRIIRDALLDTNPSSGPATTAAATSAAAGVGVAGAAAAGASASTGAKPSAPRQFSADDPPPYDREAT